MIQDAGFYIISILAVIILSAVVPMAFRKYFMKYIIIPIIVFLVMALAAFIIPNFIDGTNWEPLMGYAVFLGILSLLVSILMWFYIRGRRKKKALETQEDIERHAEEHEQTVGNK